MTIKTVLLAGTVALTPLAAQAEWIEHVFIDRMTGEKIYAAIVSPVVLADEPRPSLFDTVGGVLWVHCPEIVTFVFGAMDQIDGPTFKIEFSDLDEVPVRVKANHLVVELQAKNFERRVGYVLGFAGVDAFELRSFILNARKLLLEIPTVEYGNLYFSFDLAGTRNLHDQVCGAEQAD